MEYIVDSYAFMEYFGKDNKNYDKYFDEIVKDGAYVTSLILMEIYFFKHHNSGKNEAKKFRKWLNKHFKLIKVKQKQLIETAIFRSEMFKKKIKMSYADSLSYVLARGYNLKVLTGDEHFKNLDCVEFVK